MASRQKRRTEMSGDHRNDDHDFSKDFEIDVDIDIDFDVDVDVDVDIEKEVDIDIKSDVDLDGNSAELTMDVQALGDDSLVESIVTVTTWDEGSSISLHVISAVD
jgi:hypothetical protein